MPDVSTEHFTFNSCFKGDTSFTVNDVPPTVFLTGLQSSFGKLTRVSSFCAALLAISACAFASSALLSADLLQLKAMLLLSSQAVFIPAAVSLSVLALSALSLASAARAAADSALAFASSMRLSQSSIILSKLSEDLSISANGVSETPTFSGSTELLHICTASPSDSLYPASWKCITGAFIASKGTVYSIIPSLI